MPQVYSHNKGVKFRVVRNAAGMLYGTARVRTPAGYVWVAAAANESTVRKLLVSLYKHWLAGGERGKLAGAIAGGFFGKLFKRLRKVALNPFKTLARVAKRLAKGDIMGALKQGVKGVFRSGPLGMIPGASKFAERGFGSALKLAGKLAPLAAMVPGFGMVAAPLLRQSTRILRAAMRQDPAAINVIRSLRRRGNMRQLRLMAGLLPRIRAGATAGSIVDDLAGDDIYRQGPTGARAFHNIGEDADSPNGTWTTARDGGPVFVPSSYAGYQTIMGGPVWDALRPRSEYRDESQAFGSRDAYGAGLAVLARAR